MPDSHHTHSHHLPANRLENASKALYIGIALNVIYTAFEFGVGWHQNSLALLSDASHNLTDVLSLIISLVGLKLLTIKPTERFTYGYKKVSVLASVVNALLLMGVVAGIIIEALARLKEPPALHSGAIMITASIGILINTISALLFYSGQKQDINIKGAFLHLMVDALVSVGVVVSGGIIYLTGWNLIDPIISLIIAIVIFASSSPLLKETLNLLIDGVPKEIHLHEIRGILAQEANVSQVKDLHIWALSSQENALSTMLIIRKGASWQEISQAKKNIRIALQKHHIQHITIETDIENTD